MSYWRTIIARLARLLVHIARKLDTMAVAERFAVTPEYMAMLRQRYPDAPRHWLEAVAHRTIIQAAPARPVHRADAHKPVQMSDGAAGNERRLPSFIAPTRPARPRLEFSSLNADKPVSTPAFHAQGRSKRRRAEVLVRAIPATTRFNPFSAIGRSDERAYRRGRELRFRTEGGRADRDDRELQFRTKDGCLSPEAATPRLEREIKSARQDWPFPPERDRFPDATQPLQEAVRQAVPGLRPDPQFPHTFVSQPRSDPTWFAGRRSSPHAAGFAEQLNNWPELPTLPDENAGRSLAPSKDAIRLEHVVGTWNE